MATAAVFFCAHNSSESQCAPAYVDTVRDTWLVTRLSVRAVPTPLYISPEVSWPMSFCIVHCTSSAAALGEGKMKKGEKLLAFSGECGMLYVENDFRKFGDIVKYII